MDASQVNEKFRSALYNDAEMAALEPGKTPEDAVIVEGVNTVFGFHPERLKALREVALGWMEKLRHEFFSGTEGGSGGDSFLNLPFDKNENQWGEHVNAQELACLLIGLGLAEWVFPRDIWHVLPGGMPLIVFHTKPMSAKEIALNTEILIKVRERIAQCTHEESCCSCGGHEEGCCSCGGHEHKEAP